ncbi:hypothetical protein EIP91_001559 [Steccherinum ochraceum]|uniref:CENP-V/GFA domain-containing protein n=1 Tax=Steccherinum ochraceum TaxID=92696 RepID=A0A4R0RHP1_9APHY|nr:hypothetical protein EIP91_001559 [Steccherinum ochraceum]
MPKPFHGTCLCGEVGFEVNGDPITVSTCHCLNCRKYTGTAFTTNVVFPSGSAKITNGQPFVSTYYDGAQDSKNPLTRIFCSRCSSPLYNLGGNSGKTCAVFYSALDDFDILADPHESEQGTGQRETVKKDVVPSVEYYTKDRISWVAPVPGAEQAKTKPGRD